MTRLLSVSMKTFMIFVGVVVVLVIGLAFLFVAPAHANPSPLPPLQVYAVGATNCGDGTDTWCISGSPFTLVVVLGFGPTNKPQSAWQNVTLAMSYPDGATGSISFTPLDYGGFTPGAPILLTTAGSYGSGNPAANADESNLTNWPNPDSYNTTVWEPAAFGAHGVFVNTNDFSLFGLGISFANSLYPGTYICQNYNADETVGGIVAEPGQVCLELRYSVTTNFAKLHFDAYGFNPDAKPNGRWEINPPSHDLQKSNGGPPGERPVPEPSSLLLFGSALSALVVLRRKVGTVTA